MSRYEVKAYILTNFSYETARLDTDIFNEVEEFVHSHCENGEDCLLTDNERNSTGWIYHYDLCEEDRDWE